MLANLDSFGAKSFSGGLKNVKKILTAARRGLCPASPFCDVFSFIIFNIHFICKGVKPLALVT